MWKKVKNLWYGGRYIFMWIEIRTKREILIFEILFKGEDKQQQKSKKLQQQIKFCMYGIMLRGNYSIVEILEVRIDAMDVLGDNVFFFNELMCFWGKLKL